MTILHDVIDNLPEGIVQDVHLGECWTAVVTRIDGQRTCGMASNPLHSEPLAAAEKAALVQDLLAKPARDLCQGVFQSDLRRASAAVATINALLPRRPEWWASCNAEEVIAERGAGKRVAMVGHFPCVPVLREKVGRLDVLELRPQAGDYPANAAPEVIPQADIVAITGMTLINGTLEGLLKLCSPKSYVIMMGPSVLLSPVLFDYGVDLIGGSIVEKIDPVLQAIDAGVAEKIFPYGVRMVVMTREKAQLN